MRYHYLRVEESLVSGDYSVDDLTYTITQSRQHWMLNGKKTIHEFVGKDHTVYVLDTWDELDRAICNKIAVNFITGNYKTYSLVSGKWTEGKPK